MQIYIQKDRDKFEITNLNSPTIIIAENSKIIKKCSSYPFRTGTAVLPDKVVSTDRTPIDLDVVPHLISNCYKLQKFNYTCYGNHFMCLKENTVYVAFGRFAT